MFTKPRISIIIPVYNNIVYTRKIVDELKNKTKVPYILVFVDNGSTDGTQEFLNEFYTSDIEYVRIVHNDMIMRICLGSGIINFCRKELRI